MNQSHAVIRWIATTTAALLAGAAIAWFANPHSDPEAGHEKEATAARPVTLYRCGTPAHESTWPYTSGTTVVLRPPNGEEEVRVDLVPAPDGVDAPSILTIRALDSVRQIIDVQSAGWFTVCDFDGDGSPDILVEAGMGARVVNQQIFIYVPGRMKFVPLEYDGALQGLLRLFASMGWDLSEDAVLDNVEVQPMGDVNIVQQSLWHEDSGITSCWILRGNRLAFLAALRMEPGQRPHGYWNLRSGRGGLQVRSAGLSKRAWAQDRDTEVGEIGEISCPELLGNLADMVNG